MDDVGLLNTMALATVVETTAIDLRIAALQEIYLRGLRSSAGSRPQPPHPRAALPSPRSKRRKRRKRRTRR